MGASASVPSKYALSTATDIAKEFGNRAKDLNIIITGANSGIGFESARVLSNHGAKVILACRSKKNGDEAMEKIKKENPNADLTFIPLDLGSKVSIETFSKQFNESNRPLNVLLNNAGIMACPLARTTDGFESQFGVNHLGHFYLTYLLWNNLRKSGSVENPSRVINVSSNGSFFFPPHNREQAIDFEDLEPSNHYNIWRTYGESKLANALFATELNKRSFENHLPVIAMSLHPGGIQDTNLSRYQNNSSYFYQMISTIFQNGTFFALLSALNKKGALKNIPQGAASNVYLTLAPTEILTPGEYYSNCQVEKQEVHPYAHDHVLGVKLWDKSLTMLGLKVNDWI